MYGPSASHIRAAGASNKEAISTVNPVTRGISRARCAACNRAFRRRWRPSKPVILLMAAL
jgi:hypothetical protein